MIDKYTYEQYRAVYAACKGQTAHFLSGLGFQNWPKELLPREVFERKIARYYELQTHDDEWLFENHPADYIDVYEGEAWESVELRSDLFIIEIEHALKVTKALETT